MSPLEGRKRRIAPWEAKRGERRGRRICQSVKKGGKPLKTFFLIGELYALPVS